MFWFIQSLRLFLSDEDVFLFDPGSNLDDTILKLCVVASFVRRLSETNRHYVFLSLYLCHLISIVYTIKQSLVYRAFICNNRVFLVLPIVNCIGHHKSLAISRKEFVNKCLYHWLCDILLNKNTLIHSVRIVEHRPTTSLFRLICKHSNTFRLCVVQEWREQCDYPQYRLRNDNMSKLVLSRHDPITLRLHQVIFRSFSNQAIMSLFY